MWRQEKSFSRLSNSTPFNCLKGVLQIAYSPIAALNRIYALSKVHGSEVAIKEAEILQLKDNHFYFTLLGQLYSQIDPILSQMHYEKAISLAKTETEKGAIGRLKI